MTAQDEYDEIIRKQERARIARCMKCAANDMLRDTESDAIDGYVAAVMLDLACRIKDNGLGSDAVQ